MKYDLAVYIGRFQPFHLGHKAVLETALSQAKRVAIVVGSAECARDRKDPFTAEERIEMIRACFDQETNARFVFLPQVDYPYNLDRWLSEVNAKISGAAWTLGWKDGAYKIALIGLEKDQSSFYLKHFPQYEKIDVEPVRMINATDVRRRYFGVTPEDEYEEPEEVVPEPVRAWLNRFQNRQASIFHHISEEWAFIEDYKKDWVSEIASVEQLEDMVARAKAGEKIRLGPPFPVNFVTVDAVVTQAAHVLLVVRKHRPGMGLLALPGGFIGPDETLRQSALRELKEETGIKVPLPVLEGSIVSERTFDDPKRSERGRTITTAFHIRLNETKLPKVKGGDDAASARWVPFEDLRRDQLYEDHFDIISTMLGI